MISAASSPRDCLVVLDPGELYCTSGEPLAGRHNTVTRSLDREEGFCQIGLWRWRQCASRVRAEMYAVTKRTV